MGRGGAREEKPRASSERYVDGMVPRFGSPQEDSGHPPVAPKAEVSDSQYQCQPPLPLYSPLLSIYSYLCYRKIIYAH